MKDQVAIQNQEEMPGIGFLSFVPSEGRDIAALLFKKESLPKKHVIFYQEDRENCFYEIASGQVKLSRHTSDGREITIEILGPGDMFGYLSLFDEGCCECTATAVTKVEVYTLSRTEMERIIKSHPVVLRALISHICRRLRNAYSHLEEMASGNVQHRVSRILLEMARQEGERKDGHLVFNIRLTHQELANLAGTSRETVTRVLAFLKKEGYINVVRSEITILREEDLEEIS